MMSKYAVMFSRYLLDMASACGFIDSKNASAAMGSDTSLQPVDSPFVLVAHGASGKWDVYAQDFDHPIASFSERQAGCDYANGLAKTKKDSMVLIREWRDSVGTLSH